MYFITTKRMLEVCFSAHPNIQYRTFFHSTVPVSRFLYHNPCVTIPVSQSSPGHKIDRTSIE